MKLSSLTKLILGALLLPSLLACKVQFELEDIESTIVKEKEVVVIDQFAAILGHGYDTQTGILSLKIETNSYVGALEADLGRMACKKSFPATCSATLNVYSLQPKSFVGDLPDVLVSSEVQLDLSGLENISSLTLVDDKGIETLIPLEGNDQEIEKERRYNDLYIKEIQVDQVKEQFTIIAKHQICDASGKLQLAHRLYNRTVKNEASQINVINNKPTAEHVNISSVSIRLPAFISDRDLLYVVKSVDSRLDCLVPDDGQYFTIQQTFTFSEVGLEDSKKMFIHDKSNNPREITNAPTQKETLLPVSDVKVDLENNKLTIITFSNKDADLKMGPCAVVDRRPSIDHEADFGFDQVCTAKFVSTGEFLEGAFNRGPKSHEFTLNEVGLGLNGSQLNIRFQSGGAVITIDRLGKVDISMHYYSELANN